MGSCGIDSSHRCSLEQSPKFMRHVLAEAVCSTSENETCSCSSCNHILEEQIRSSRTSKTLNPMWLIHGQEPQVDPTNTQQTKQR